MRNTRCADHGVLNCHEDKCEKEALQQRVSDLEVEIDGLTDRLNDLWSRVEFRVEHDR
jgi:hypothetical protein